MVGGSFRGLTERPGRVERITADGEVSGTRRTSAGTDHFSAAQVEFEMLPEDNLMKQMIATGGVERLLAKGRIRNF